MFRRSVLHRAVGWGVVAFGLGGLGTAFYMLLSRFGSVRGSGLSGTYFETASLLHVPAWALVGLVLVFLGFGIMADDPDNGTDEG